MSVVRIRKKESIYQNRLAYSQFEFPKEADGVIYVRQSSLVQVRNNIHSFEMQTDRFEEHFRSIGCTGKITIIADDEAMSGTLDIHARPGMTKMVKMIEKKQVGWIAAVHVNRFTRDRWLITPGVLMKTCYDHDVWIVTLRMQFNFKDDYCQRVFMLEAEEAARHLEWMKLVLGGGRRVASSNGYYDGRGLNTGYIVDRRDEKRKKYVIYEPHAEVIRWLFRRFLELDGNFPALLREVEQKGNLFPEFEPGIDTRGLKRRKSRKRESWRKPTEWGIIGILTNPVYIGWWIPFDGGVIENNHDAIVDEVLFAYAHKRLSSYDLNGERQKPVKATRNGRAQGLLKKVVKAPNGDPIYATYQADKQSYRYAEYTGLFHAYRYAVPIKCIDSAFTDKFLERLNNDFPQDYQWKDTTKEKQEGKEAKIKSIKKSIQEAQERRRHIMDVLADKETPVTKQMKFDYIKECEGLEDKIDRLSGDLKTADEDEDEEKDQKILYEISTLIPDIIQEWKKLSFHNKVRFIGALVRKVTLSIPASSWIKMEIEWKLPGWNSDIAHIRRSSDGGAWTDEEDAIMHELYPTADAAVILKALPTRTWRAIISRSFKELRITRTHTGKNSIRAQDYLNISMKDIEYAEENGLDANVKNPQWYM